MPPTAHARTPILQVVDPRGLAVRTVAYRRNEPDEEARAEVDRVAMDALGRPVAAWDPRLWQLASSETPSPATANVRSHHSLDGTTLRSDSTDAGWRVGLVDDAGLDIMAWDARDATHRTTHDTSGRVVSRTVQHRDEPERCLERWTYAGPEGAASNRAGRLAFRYETAGVSEHASYDLFGGIVELNQCFLKTLDEPDWPEDIKGRESLLEATRYVTRWIPDALGTAVEQIDARGHVRRFAFDTDGALARATLKVADGTPQTLVHSLTHDAMGRVASQTAGNGVVSRAGFDEATGRLTTLQATRPDGTVLQNLRYTYDPVGNVIAIDDDVVPTRFWKNRRTDGTCTYRYDTRYQLIEATGREHPAVSQGPALPDYGIVGDASALAPYTETYVYDAGSNLIELRHAGGTTYTRRTAVAPNGNRSLPWEPGAPERDVAAAFDAHGNRRALQTGQPMRWNTRDELAAVTLVSRGGAFADDDTERYVYDAGGERRRKCRVARTGNITQSHEVRYLPGLELRHHSASGEDLDVITANAGRAQVQVLRWTAGKPSAMTDAQIRYRLDNHLGSAVLELDADARIIGEEAYLPFGGTAWRSARSAVEADYRTVRYSGHERDATGLYYYGFRYYAPWLARWINPDPGNDVDGLNRYTFARNNPSGNIDLGGMVSFGTLVQDLESFRKMADKSLKRDVREHVMQKLMQTPGVLDFVDGKVIASVAEAAVREKDKSKAKKLLAQIAAAEELVDKQIRSNPDIAAKARAREERELMREASRPGPSRAAAVQASASASADSAALELLWVFAHTDIQSGLRSPGWIDYRSMEGHMYRGMGIEHETNKQAKAVLKDKLSNARALAKSTPTNELAQRLNENIHKHAKEGPLLYRGMPRHLVPEDGEYQPGRFFAASTSQKVAASFGELVEMRGRALSIGDHYAGISEGEYLFPSTARYRVDRGRTTRLRLTRIA